MMVEAVPVQITSVEAQGNQYLCYSGKKLT